MAMRLFYHTAATCPERKRKPRQFPEKLRTIGKYTSMLFLYAWVQPMGTHSHAFSGGQPISWHFPCCLGWAGLCVLVSPINSATRTLSTLLPLLCLRFTLTYYPPHDEKSEKKQDTRHAFNLSFHRRLSRVCQALTCFQSFKMLLCSFSCGERVLLGVSGVLNESPAVRGLMSATAVPHVLLLSFACARTHPPRVQDGLTVAFCFISTEASDQSNFDFSS